MVECGYGLMVFRIFFKMCVPTDNTALELIRLSHLSNVCSPVFANPTRMRSSGCIFVQSDLGVNQKCACPRTSTCQRHTGLKRCCGGSSLWICRAISLLLVQPHQQNAAFGAGHFDGCRGCGFSVRTILSGPKTFQLILGDRWARLL